MEFQIPCFFICLFIYFKRYHQDVLCDRAHEKQRLSLLTGENELFILSVQ